MTTLENRPNSALLIVDIQNAVLARAHERDAVVGRSAAFSRRRSLAPLLAHSLGVAPRGLETNWQWFGPTAQGFMPSVRAWWPRPPELAPEHACD